MNQTVATDCTHLEPLSYHEELMHAALADLERVTSAVVAHNMNRMQHPGQRAWLNGRGKEADNAVACIVSTLPRVEILRRLARGEELTFGVVSAAIARMQRDLERSIQRIQKRAVRHRADVAAAAAGDVAAAAGDAEPNPI